MMEPELCASRVLSPCNEESGDDELSVLPRHTKVIVTGNNRTKSVLVGLQGVVKKAVGLGGWHWLVLKNGVEVKLQRNALSVLEHPTGNEEDFDNDHVNSSSGSELGVKENDFTRSLEFQRHCKPRFKYPKSYVPSATTKSIYRGSYQAFQPIHKPQLRVNMGKLGTSTLRRYCRHFNLVSNNPNPTREQLISIVQRHFTSQLIRLDEASVITEFVNAARRRKFAELARKRTEREM
ncbi:PREDICTED: uncharacterized protein LOC101311569 isoform X1 [Fragaria vesca subsp. vesca]|uniref:uncharacterized protein LOC101311569 isoform X1 n=1 Tax=Fragaria vesca subsp. vesca TaxID=101020 RepID=UPI0002C330BC|nr:PREDICTED: uncharacterized protein LOC101311569 isoform X1 [Fragaria vesca subsp. vesca]